jgi:hypothetical protein
MWDSASLVSWGLGWYGRLGISEAIGLVSLE